MIKIDKIAIMTFFIVIFSMAVFAELSSDFTNRSAISEVTTRTPTLEVLEDKLRGVVCYKLDWSNSQSTTALGDTLSCLPSQWLYEAGEMK